MKRQEFDRATKAAICLRATDASGVLRCERCGLAVKRGGYDIDHTIADGLRIDKSRKLTANDGMLLCKSCHGEKTPNDIAIIAKAKRVEANRLGIERRPPVKITSRGFASSRKEPRIDKSALPALPPSPLMRGAR